MLAAGQPPAHPFTPHPPHPLPAAVSLSHRICIPKSTSATPGEDCSSLIYGVKAKAGAFSVSDPSATPTPPSFGSLHLGFLPRRWGIRWGQGKRSRGKAGKFVQDSESVPGGRAEVRYLVRARRSAGLESAGFLGLARAGPASGAGARTQKFWESFLLSVI